MAKDEELVVKISADVSELKKGLAKANQSLETLADKSGKAGDDVEKLGDKSKASAMKTKALGMAVMGVEVAVSALSAATVILVKNQIQSAKTAELWSRKLGIANTTFSKLSAAGAKFGLEAETVGDALKDLNVRITDAAGGAKAYEEIFVKIGLSTKELVKLSPEDQFYKVADAIAKADSNTRRWALDEINDSMFRLGPLMEQGSAKIRAMGEEAAKTGQAMSAWEFKEIKKVNEALIDVQASTTALGNALSIHLAPGLELAAKWAEKLSGVARDLLGTSETAMRDRLIEINEELGKFMRTSAERQRLGEQGGRAGAKARSEELAWIKLIQERGRLQAAIASKAAGPASGAPSPNGLGGGADTFQDDQEARAVKVGLQAAADARQVYAANELIAKVEHDKMMAEATEIGLIAADEARQVYAANEIISKAEQYALELEANKGFWASMFEIDRQAGKANADLWASGWGGKMDVMSDFMGQMSVLMKTNSRKQFEIGKAAAIAQVAIDTPKAAMSAYSAMAGIPIIGPALGVAAAGAAIASGVAQMQNIKSQSMGGGSNASAGGIQAASGGAGDAQGGGGGGQENVTNFDVNLQGQSFSGEQIRALLSGINSELEDGAKLGAINVR